MDKDFQILQLQNTVADLAQQLSDLRATFDRHQHLGTDGSMITKIIVAPQEDIQVGCTFIDSVEKINSGAVVNDQISFIVTGKENPDSTTTFPSAQLVTEHQASTNGTTNQTFMYSQRPPLYYNFNTLVSVTVGASTLTDSSKNWTVNELAGAYINMYNSSLSFVSSRQIASNTATVITIDGTWPSSVSNGYYVISMPFYFGSADYPWRQGYFLGQDVSSGGTGVQRRVLRFGGGVTAGIDVVGIYMGSGSPEAVVTAQAGSIYMRTDGGASTSFYVKETKTFTVTIASPAVFSSVAHGLAIGDTVKFSTTGALPTGLTAGLPYYIISAGFGVDAFQVSATSGGSAVNTSGGQSGTHTFSGGKSTWTAK